MQHPEWEAQWAKDEADRAKFGGKPWRSTPLPPSKMRLAYALGIGVLAMISLAAARGTERVPDSPQVQQMKALYAEAPIGWRLLHPFDPLMELKNCPPGCPCLCSNGTCIPVCGDPTPGPHR